MEDNDEGGHVSEEFLSCPICTEEYADPRSLPCLHTFCLTCISDHIDANTKGVHVPKGFDCPKCHQFVDSPNVLQGPSTWAESLPQNQFIIGLIEAVKLRSEGRKCDPCDTRGENTLAVTWCENCGEAMCEDCENQHSSLKISRNHKQVDIASIKLQPIKSTLLRTPCQEHEGKFLDFYCEDHAQVICSTCATGFHRLCTSILSSSEAASKQRDEAKSVMEKLKHQTSWGLRILDNRKHAVETIEDAASNVKKQISSIRQQINDILSSQEERALAELEDLKKAEVIQFQREIERTQDLVNTTKNATAVLQNSMTHGTDADVLITYNKARREGNFCEKSLKEVSRHMKDVFLVFSPDQSLQIFLGTLKEMGKFSLSHQEVRIPPPYTVRADTILIPEERIVESRNESMESNSPKKSHRQKRDTRNIDSDLKIFPPSPSITPVPIQERRNNIPQGKLEVYFKVRNAQDRDNCCITGAEILNDGRILLADQVHRKIKLYDPDYRWVGERVLSARPFDITAISSSEIAVTLPREKRFLLMQVRESDITILAAIQTGAKCWGISYSNYMLAVCCYDSPPCVKLMSRDGRELKVISKDNVGHNLFFFPEYIVLDRTAGCMYVTDRYKKTVIALTTQGEKLWEIRYDGLKLPKGIALHGNRLFVAGNKSHNILMVNTEGEIMGDVIVEGVNNPHKIVLTPNSDKLLVSQYNMTLIDVERNTVKVFSLPW
ncbi:E3 ubiquitin-protein ligase TRIM56-like [Ruditapes philippinarum]|uniref:E3 ubiquitin-protein ligase TRIM56-like n=1 Tax=Ruditapes philippinarum TaxID=129788 RepID=UPI00295A583D|nr:E3 ubiquitin-protein ligase TRIM56-like [Ruditapes philippinarum]